MARSFVYFGAKGRRKKNRKIWGFYPKRREGVISETQFYYTFNLGHFRVEGGGQKLNFSIFLINLIEKMPFTFQKFPYILYTNLISMHKCVILLSFSCL